MEKNLEQKLDELNTWLCTHPSHPDFMKIAGDRNHISTKLDMTRKKIDNINNHVLPHGDNAINSIHIPQQSANTFNKQQ